MPDLTKQEQALLTDIAKLEKSRDDYDTKIKKKATALAHLRKQYTQERIVQVGHLAAAAGLLWVEDAALEKAFVRLAEALLAPERQQKETQP